MSSYRNLDDRLVWFRHILVPILWLLLIGVFVFILLVAPGPIGAYAFVGLAILGWFGTDFLIRS